MKNLDYEKDMKVEEGLFGKGKRTRARKGEKERAMEGSEYDHSTLCTCIKLSQRNSLLIE
jgi:hypothetical protein